MGEQASKLGPIAGHPMSVFSTTREPRMRDQGCAPKEIRVRPRRFRIGEIAIVHGSDPQAFHRLASNQVVDVAADADRSEKSRKHEVVVISSFFPGCYREHAEPFQRIFLPTNRIGPRVGHLLFPVMLACIVRRIRHDLWIESMPSVSATSLIPRSTSQPVLALPAGLMQVRPYASKLCTIVLRTYAVQGRPAWRKVQGLSYNST